MELLFQNFKEEDRIHYLVGVCSISKPENRLGLLLYAGTSFQPSDKIFLFFKYYDPIQLTIGNVNLLNHFKNILKDYIGCFSVSPTNSIQELILLFTSIKSITTHVKCFEYEAPKINNSLFEIHRSVQSFGLVTGNFSFSQTLFNFQKKGDIVVFQDDIVESQIIDFPSAVKGFFLHFKSEFLNF